MPGCLQQVLAWLPVPELLLLALELLLLEPQSLQLELAWLLELVFLQPELACPRPALASLRQQEFPQQEPQVFLS